MTQYRQMYNKAKSLLAQRHNEELHSIMVELGYAKKEKVAKAKDVKEVKEVAVVETKKVSK